MSSPRLPCCASLALLAAPARGADSPPPAISVTRRGHTSRSPPDLAQIDAGVATDAKTAREASDANNTAMGKVLLALKGAGIDEKDYPDLAPVAAAAICAEPQRRAAPPHRRLSRHQPRHRQLRDVTKVAGVDRHAGRRRRQRYRRHQFHGVAGLESCSTRRARRRSPMRAARPRFMPRPPASRSARP